MQKNRSNLKYILKNSSIVMMDNFFSLIKGLIFSIGLPKILSISEYGIYRVFSLYIVFRIISFRINRWNCCEISWKKNRGRWRKEI